MCSVPCHCGRVIPFGQSCKQQSTIYSNRLETAGVDVGAMVVRYFRFGRVARHRQPKKAEDEENIFITVVY